MESLNYQLERVKDSLRGRTMTDEEVLLVREQFEKAVFPDALIDILGRYNIIDHQFSLTEEQDLSGFGVEMRWLTPKSQIEEAYDYYPGILAIKEKYLPIGSCLLGSGDPYFLKMEENEWDIVRIPHDSVNEDELDYDSLEIIGTMSSLLASF